jgi:hypothetical protein
MISTVKNLKRIHAKCSDILEMIESAEYIMQHHSDQISRLKTAGLDYKHQMQRLVINAEIIERLKSYYLNQIQKITK